MTDILGPADAPNFTTSRPADDRTIGATDTWSKDCTGPNANDGTKLRAALVNSIIANLRALVRGNGNTGAGPAVVAEDNADDMLLRGVKHLIQRGQAVYGVDSGAANALTVSLSPPLAEYKEGFQILVKAAATNTGASTININALGNKSIKTVDGADLAAGAFKAGQMICLAYDGTNFQFISVLGAAAFSLPKAKITLAAIASLAHATYTPHGMSVASSNDMGAGPSISGGNGVVLPAGTYAFQIYTAVTITLTNNATQVAWGCRITKNGTLQQSGVESSYLTAGQNGTLFPGFSGTIQVNGTDVIQVLSYIACTLSGDYGGGNASVGFVTFERIGA